MKKKAPGSLPRIGIVQSPAVVNPALIWVEDFFGVFQRGRRGHPLYASVLGITRGHRPRAPAASSPWPPAHSHVRVNLTTSSRQTWVTENAGRVFSKLSCFFCLSPRYVDRRWLRGTVVRTLVFDRRTFPVPRSTCSWRVTTYVGKTSATGQPTWPTQTFIISGSINWVVSNFIGRLPVAPSAECLRG